MTIHTLPTDDDYTWEDDKDLLKLAKRAEKLAQEEMDATESIE